MRLDEHRPPATRPIPFSNTSPATPVGGPLANSVEFPARSTPAPKAPSVAPANPEAPTAPKAPKGDKKTAEQSLAETAAGGGSARSRG